MDSSPNVKPAIVNEVPDLLTLLYCWCSAASFFTFAFDQNRTVFFIPVTGCSQLAGIHRRIVLVPKDLFLLRIRGYVSMHRATMKRLELME
jgi:hypothetical protein